MCGLKMATLICAWCPEGKRLEKPLMMDSAFGHFPSYRQKTEAQVAWNDERKTLELRLLRHDRAQYKFSVR